jgi:hypothetical protein
LGETGTSFARRHYAHFCEYTCGAYTIHDPQSFAAGRRAPRYTGFTYPKERWRRAQPFIDDFGAIAPVLTEMLGVLRLFLAPLESDQRTRRRIEGALSSLLSQADPEVSEFQGRKARWLRRPDEPPLKVTSASEWVLRGVPSVFEA